MSNESQHTHMSFDGLCDMFGALCTEIILGEVEGCQRPDGEAYISEGGTGDILSVLALTCTQE